uniref:Uncharacterized protein n=1 Tax=Trichogramma kaykai TaxID=54128 RepID=A0ABD2VWJ1_9HYME
MPFNSSRPGSGARDTRRAARVTTPERAKPRSSPGRSPRWRPQPVHYVSLYRFTPPWCVQCIELLAREPSQCYRPDRIDIYLHSHMYSRARFFT